MDRIIYTKRSINQITSIVKTITIAAAQIIPSTGDVTKNIRNHEHLVVKAASNGVNLIVFPELSLTGYDPELASNLAMTFFDPKLETLLALSYKYNMIIIAGAPVELGRYLYIGAFVFMPDHSVSLYLKHHLHHGEEKVFHPGSFNPPVYVGDERASLAICADITHSDHLDNAALSGSTIYLAGVFISPEGYENDISKLQDGARKNKMAIVLANFGGSTGNTQSAGKSAIWSDAGGKVAGMEGIGQGLVIAKKEAGKWTGKVLQ